MEIAEFLEKVVDYARERGKRAGHLKAKGDDRFGDRPVWERTEMQSVAGLTEIPRASERVFEAWQEGYQEGLKD